MLRGKPVVLVAARTRRAAPACKKWMLRLVREHGRAIHLHQVIVLDHPWYIPRSLARKQIRKFVPKQHHWRVLLEWYTVFSDSYNIPKHDLPTLFVLDPAGVLRLRLKGKLSEARLKRVNRVVQRHAAKPRKRAGAAR